MQNCCQGSKEGCFGVPCLAEEAEVCELCCLDLTQLQRKGKHLQIFCIKFRIKKHYLRKRSPNQRLIFEQCRITCLAQ